MENERLRINEFEIEWRVGDKYFWLREGDYSSLDLNLNQLEDLKEIIKRFEEELKKWKSKRAKKKQWIDLK